MNKSIFIIIFLLFSKIVLAQQNEDFKKIKDYFDGQKVLLTNEFRKKAKFANNFEKSEVETVFAEFMKKMDSVQNSAYVTALIRVKNREDLQSIKPNLDYKSAKNTIKSDTFNGDKPKYPGGIDLLRKQISDLFYFDSEILDEKILKSNVTFIVEKEGYVSNVLASGDNPNFNRQAMIALYLLPEKFSPAIINGLPVRYQYSLPILMNFDK